jgi:hypothetical protein
MVGTSGHLQARRHPQASTGLPQASRRLRTAWKNFTVHWKAVHLVTTLEVMATEVLSTNL